MNQNKALLTNQIFISLAKFGLELGVCLSNFGWFLGGIPLTGQEWNELGWARTY